MKLIKNQKYQAELELTTAESLFSNKRIAVELEKKGFTQVVVTGALKKRMAIGVWSGENTANGDVPPSVKNIKIIS